MQNVLESNEWREIWVLKIFKSEIQNGGRNNSVFLQIRLPQKLAPPPSLICANFKSLSKLLVNQTECTEI